MSQSKTAAAAAPARPLNHQTRRRTATRGEIVAEIFAQTRAGGVAGGTVSASTISQQPEHIFAGQDQNLVLIHG
jgi:hypothetical protein